MLSRIMNAQLPVYIAVGATDLRKSIDGLSILVQESFDLNPLSGALFVFCNRKRRLMKVLYWEGNGFCLWQKRLEKDRFRWPEADCDVIEVGPRELSWLLDGLSLEQRQAYRMKGYELVA